MIKSLAVCFMLFFNGISAAMPSPFTRELYVTNPAMSGNDVIIFQNMIMRDNAVGTLSTDGVYGSQSAAATSNFQLAHGLKDSGKFDEDTATLLLSLHSADGVKDSGFTAASMGYLYKVFIPVYENRSVESAATLFDAYNNIIMTFPARTHGHVDPNADPAVPDYGLNQFTSNGNTITGLVELDLNSPEPDPSLYGPWPVNRIVRGLEGNAQFMLPYIRDGQLIHTGNWTDQGWDPKKPMPNSAGCVHSHPEHVERIYQALVKLGVTVNENPFSGKEYPFKPQGIGVIQYIG
ncbi:unnamed protein product [Symbiodinium microadriaticum]|nr:unnamed protein product [Symbiodinium microadriaticum]